MHGNVETMAVLPSGGGDGSRRRDSIILTFRDAKISVLEFDDSIHELRTRWGKGDVVNERSIFSTTNIRLVHIWDMLSMVV